MIIIHYDYTNGTELSYAEGIQKKDNFFTNCLDFFCNDTNVFDVKILCYNGDYISRNELLLNNGDYTDKEIRKEHNILKMLKAGTFKFKKPS